jgi:butyrate kinase
MEAAATIITNKNQQAWVDKFTTGYTTNRGILIDPIVFESFVEKAHKQATPEEREAVHALNVKHLAKAITEVRKQENEKMQPEFA